MQLSDFERAYELVRKLRRARADLEAFKAVAEDTIRVFASVPSNSPFAGILSKDDHEVDLLPAMKSVVVSAAERRVHKLETELAQLGIQA